MDDKVIKININVGFRIQPRTELYFKKIVLELVNNKELNLHIRPDGSTKYNNQPDFNCGYENFSVENELIREGVLLNTFSFKTLGLSDDCFWIRQK